METPIPVAYLRWIALLPLVGAAINGLAGALVQRVAGKRAISAIACTPAVLSFALSVRAFLQLRALEPEARALVDRVLPWIQLGDLRVEIAFAVDPLSVVLALVVTGVGGLIHFYSIGYMHEDRAYWRYFAYLNLFLFAMLTLVLGENLLLFFVGWEGVGLCSYALIGFWYSDLEKAAAGTKAFLVNRIGDFGFVLGILLLFWALAGAGHPTLSFGEIARSAHLLAGKQLWGVDVPTLVALLFFIGATGKSAQIPLYVWLPDAMAGPTPVSALIHAATMVTAGVYMIARLNAIYSMAPFALGVVAAVGAATAVFAATIGLAQNDIKKVLAYSTVSQLGYMFLAMGVGAYAAGIFHLVTHAFFKACLFLGSGSVIHALGGEQDMRKMGGLRRHMPITFWTFLASTLAIAGIPPTAGFFSKDEILWRAFSSPHGSSGLWLLGTIGAALTAFYMFRQVFLVFFGECRADPHVREHLHESPPIMTYPLIVLAALALAGGFVGVPGALGGSNALAEFLSPVLGGHGAHAAHAESRALEIGFMATSVAVAALGIGLAVLVYYRGVLRPEVFSEIAGGRLYRLVYHKYYVDEIYEATFVRGTLWLSRLCSAFDRYVIDFLVDGSARLTAAVSWLHGLFDNYVIDGIVNRVADATIGFGNRFRRLQMGSINGYLYVAVIGVVAVMIARLL